MNDQAILSKIDAIIAQLQALRAVLAAPAVAKAPPIAEIGGGPGSEV